MERQAGRELVGGVTWRRVKAWNAGLHVKVKDRGDDAGVASATARTLAFYAAKSGDKAAQKLAKELLDRMWNK